MSRIALLDDEVINQIAAGEVVERPASVVKELIENSIDAGATHIDVEVAQGGKTAIVVRDDGCGMAEEDLRLAILRHATSKLTGFADIYSLATLGFRGEALPSIASVSKLIITSRQATADTGYRLIMAGGEIVEEGEVGAPIGTQIEVRNLLATVPARLKFLKSDSSEAGQITDTVTRVAMAHPSVGFDLKHNGRQVLRVKTGEEPSERIARLLDKKKQIAIHPVSHTEGGVKVEAFLAAPDQAKTTSKGTFLFVGRRPIRDRSIVHAMLRGYGELIPKGRFPLGVLYISVPDGRVDVNVHPQKQEVRFSDSQTVFSAVRHAVAKGVSEAPWLHSALDSSFVNLTPVSSVASRYARERQMTWASPGSSFRRPEHQGYGQPSSGSRQEEDSTRLNTGAPAQSGTGTALDWSTVVSLSQPAPASASASASASAPAFDAEEFQNIETGGLLAEGTNVDVDVSLPGRGSKSSVGFTCFSDLRFIGQIDRTYLLCEADGEMVLIDQHAAHERVVFERLKAKDPKLPATQAVLFPVTLDVDASEAAVFEDNQKLVLASGFEVEVFGQNGGTTTLAIKGTPAGLRDDSEVVLRQLLEELEDKGGSLTEDARTNKILATVACHSSVRAGDKISSQEVYALFRDMDETDTRTHCPHGRPTTLRISLREIERRFGRP